MATHLNVECKQSAMLHLRYINSIYLHENENLCSFKTDISVRQTVQKITVAIYFHYRPPLMMSHRSVAKHSLLFFGSQCLRAKCRHATHSCL